MLRVFSNQRWMKRALDGSKSKLLFNSCVLILVHIDEDCIHMKEHVAFSTIHVCFRVSSSQGYLLHLKGEFHL